MSYVAAAISATGNCIDSRAPSFKDNRLFDPPDVDGRMPCVSKWDP
jgi:hypothetical protein